MTLEEHLENWEATLKEEFPGNPDDIFEREEPVSLDEDIHSVTVRSKEAF